MKRLGFLTKMGLAVEKETIERLCLSEKIKVSVILPHFYSSRAENFQGLLEDLRKQSFQAMELLIVHGVAPQGKAINQAARLAQGEILVIIDDDSRMGHAQVIENLVRVIEEDPSIGMAGASVVTSDQATWFQRAAGKQFPRFHMPIVKEVTESDFPGHPCAAFPKKVFLQVGMEREDILRGLDPDLRVRIRKAGYRVVLAPETWIHHPLPDSLFKFIQVFLRNGYGSAHLQWTHPELSYDTSETLSAEHFTPKHAFFYRVLRYPFRLAKDLIRGHWIRLLGEMVYLLGYLAGTLSFIFSRKLPKDRVPA